MSNVRNPSTPYVGPIPGGLQDGTEIQIKGNSERHHTGFLISLQCGGSLDPRSECAFAFNPRFNEKAVIRNSLQDGSWGAEERNGGFPFHIGFSVDIVINVTPYCYSINVNGRHFCDYNHRVPIHMVTHITVEQGIRCTQINFKTPLSYPSAGGSEPIHNPAVPFEHKMGQLYPNKMICISGIPHPNPSRFSVYIQHGPHHEPYEIGMVFDARFAYNADRNVVVRNHKKGFWGTEERVVPFFPFNPNVPFEMIILVEPSCFKVAVNNQHLLEFNHRIQPINRLDTLRVDGDVRLIQIRFQG